MRFASKVIIGNTVYYYGLQSLIANHFMELDACPGSPSPPLSDLGLALSMLGGSGARRAQVVLISPGTQHPRHEKIPDIWCKKY
jgi:hypothetical protein